MGGLVFASLAFPGRGLPVLFFPPRLFSRLYFSTFDFRLLAFPLAQISTPVFSTTFKCPSILRALQPLYYRSNTNAYFRSPFVSCSYKYPGVYLSAASFPSHHSALATRHCISFRSRFPKRTSSSPSVPYPSPFLQPSIQILFLYCDCRLLLPSNASRDHFSGDARNFASERIIFFLVLSSHLRIKTLETCGNSRVRYLVLCYSSITSCPAKVQNLNASCTLYAV